MQQNLRTFLLASVVLLTLGIAAQGQPDRVTPVPDGSTNFVTAGNLVYFPSGDSLLRTNGTEVGTVLLRSGFTSAFTDMTGFKGMLFFISGNELWRSDGTPSGTIQLTIKSELKIFSGTVW